MLSRRKHEQKMMQVVGVLAGLVCLLLGYVLLENRHGRSDAIDPRDGQNFMRNEHPADKREDFTLMTADQNTMKNQKAPDLLHSLNVGYAGADALPKDITFNTDNAIPEPTTIAVLGGGMLLVLYRRNRSMAKAG